MHVCLFTLQQIVYLPVDIPLSDGKAGMQSSLQSRSLPYESRLRHWALERETCTYQFLGGTPSISILRRWSSNQGGTGVLPGVGGVEGGIGRLCQSGCGTPGSLPLKSACSFRTVPSCRARLLWVWFSSTMVKCFPDAAFTFWYPGNSTLSYITFQTLLLGVTIWCCVSTMTAPENTPLYLLAVLHARHLLGCSGHTRPPCSAIVADMLRT